MADTTFRTAKEPAQTESSPAKVEDKNPDRPEGSTQVEEPPIHYQELKGHPYSAEHFDMVKHWNDPSTSFKKSFEAIDEYYGDKVRSGEIEDGKESFNNLIKSLYKEIGLDKNAGKAVAISKIAEYTRFRKRIAQIDKDAKTYENN